MPCEPPQILWSLGGRGRPMWADVVDLSQQRGPGDLKDGRPLAVGIPHSDAGQASRPRSGRSPSSAGSLVVSMPSALAKPSSASSRTDIFTR